MGLRDRLKEAARAVIGRPEGARPSSPAPAAPRPAPPATVAPPAPPKPAPAPAEETWVAVADAARVTESRAGTFPIPGGTIVAIFRYKGSLYAIDNACAHEDGPVGEGAVDGCRVQCPYHDWEYDFTTGACRTDPERALATWAVRERGGKIEIGRRLTEGTQARGGEHNDGMETITR